MVERTRGTSSAARAAGGLARATPRTASAAPAVERDKRSRRSTPPLPWLLRPAAVSAAVMVIAAEREGAEGRTKALLPVAVAARARAAATRTDRICACVVRRVKCAVGALCDEPIESGTGRNQFLRLPRRAA